MVFNLISFKIFSLYTKNHDWFFSVLKMHSNYLTIFANAEIFRIALSNDGITKHSFFMVLTPVPLMFHSSVPRRESGNDTPNVSETQGTDENSPSTCARDKVRHQGPGCSSQGQDITVRSWGRGRRDVPSVC